MKKLSVIIISKNEAKNIARTIESVTFADEIILIDAFSTDKTVQIAKKFNVKIYKRKWTGYSDQKRFALSKASGKWILSIDADEEVTENLKLEILKAINQDEISGFEICRRNYFIGKFLNHSGWYPDYQLKLFLKQKGSILNRAVHEGIEVDGKKGKLKSDLNHYSYYSIDQYLEKQNIYTTLEVQNKKDLKKAKKVTWLNFVFNPLSTFLRIYFVKSGWRDGIRGLILACYSSLYTLLKYAKVWELQLAKKNNFKNPPIDFKEMNLLKEKQKQ